ncbi:MAG: Rpn family recombination-promoting nuclease/putative transposase [Lachnospiraceae bacterium]|nr:Rpn family recombination-promoting nuclease/putative transposase [Lachnospiraceae bacterium]
MKPPHVIAEDHIRIYNIQLPRFREQTHDLRKPLDAWLYLLDTAHQEHISLDEVIEMEPTLQEAIDLDAGLKQFTEGYSRASADPEVQEEYRKYTSELLRVTGMLHAAEAKGEARGETKERLRAIQNLMETTSMSAEQAMRALKILESEMSNYINQLHRSHDIVRSD